MKPSCDCDAPSASRRKTHRGNVHRCGRGMNDQALLYYIKSYLAFGPDPTRRSVIENLYTR
ncbi:MAG: hypothetical protein ACT4OT_12140 [Acidobacteriota bacterium]